MSKELSEECDYVLEAQYQTRYRELILNDEVLRRHTAVPEVFPELSTAGVLTSRLIEGESIEKAVAYSQVVRNAIARTLLIVSIKELFKWRLVQSDPNFGNFLYNHKGRCIHLIDFGATRDYSKSFVDNYMILVWAAANKDRETLMSISKTLGFVTGDETAEFLTAHTEAGLVVGEPFASNEPFDFANSKLTVRLEQYGNTFMKHRLTPPPQEVYSLHRKLAGAFLLCIRLKAVIPCRDILEECYTAFCVERDAEEEKERKKVVDGVVEGK
jgi:aarF domain-containing kinase